MSLYSFDDAFLRCLRDRDNFCLPSSWNPNVNSKSPLREVDEEDLLLDPWRERAYEVIRREILHCTLNSDSLEWIASELCVGRYEAVSYRPRSQCLFFDTLALILHQLSNWRTTPFSNLCLLRESQREVQLLRNHDWTAYNNVLASVLTIDEDFFQNLQNPELAESVLGLVSTIL